MLARQLEKSANGDEDAQNLVQLLACTSRREQVLEYLSNPLNLLVERNAPLNPTLTAKGGFLWAVVCVMTHNSEHSTRLLMALKPADNVFYSQQFAEGELRRAHEVIVDEYLLSHWQSGHLSTAQFVQWTRAALDCDYLFDSLELLMEQMREQHSDNAVLLHWTHLVSQLITLRRSDGEEEEEDGEKNQSRGATDDEAEP